MRTASRLVAYSVFVLTLVAFASAAENATDLLDQAGVKQGLCLHLGCGQSDGEGRTADLAASSEMLVHGLALDDAACDRARISIRKQGVKGQAQVEKLTTKSLPYVDDLADLMIVENATALQSAGIDAAELARVLAPGGVLLEKADGQWKKTVKPFHPGRPWTHPLGGPDGNRVTAAAVTFPVGVRWQDGLPLNIVHWASARSYVAANGRVFSISMTESENLLTDPRNHQAKQQWLTARSSASGLPLWKLPLGTEDPRSDLNTLNSLPLATDGKVVLVARDKGLVAVNAADGEILRPFPVEFPTNRLVFSGGITVAAGWESVGRKAMWDPVNEPKSSLWDVRFGGTGQGAVEAFEAATAKLLWKDPVAAQQVLATDDTVVYLTQGAYPVKEQAVVARALETGELRWRTTHEDLTGGADLFLMCLGKDSVVLGRHKTGSAGAGVGCKQIVVLSLSDGKKRWEAPSDGGPMALLVDDEIWFGSKRFEPGSGKILGNSPLRITSGMCVPPILLGDVGGTPRGGQWTDVKTGQRFRSGGVRGSCVQGAAATDGKMYIAQNWCRCAPGQVPGFMALGHATLPTDEAFQARRLVESGAVPVPPANAAGAAAEWSTFRGNAERSGACPSAAPTALPITWRVSILPDTSTPLAAVWHDALAPRLSAPVVAHDTVYVAACCEGEVVALDLTTGREKWRAATGARIDSPPTVHGGLCLTGSHDGYLYAFASDTGKLVWRTRVAPEERRVVAFGQVESAWPVVGSPLVVGNVGYAIAGRSTEMDGGCAVLAFDPATGATHWARRASATPGRRCDVLAWRAGAIAMQRWIFDPASGAMQATDRKENRGENLDGLLDGTWTWLGTRRGGKFPVGKLTADVVVWDDARYFGSGPGRKVFAIDRAAADQADPKQPAYAWTWACPNQRQVEVMALAANSLVAAGRVWDSDPQKMHGFLTLLSKKDGRPVAETLLPAAPVHHGVCVVPDRAIVCLEDGSVACLGQ
ncbi:MAG: PQQ-binding-like beta-propeller repeat protein [Planctomycetes bacterium]|nr:PQQ-binding-like beta-propeller repeat protein [Planctomycetota bacterium]MBL7037360.1 PQQ-binding-like beta-propeller repeat protein [Pirellulaceae bacterium]